MSSRSVKVLAQQGTSADVRCCDAKDLLDGLPAGSVDLVLTSPPYFVGKSYDTSREISQFEREIERVTPSILRVLKPGGHICWQSGYHVSGKDVTPLDVIIASIMRDFRDVSLRNRIIWTYGHGAHAAKRFSGRHETILWYAKPDQAGEYYFDLDQVRVPQKYPGKRHYKGPKKGEWSGNPLGKNPSDIWEIPNVKSRHIEKTDHPCQFPVALAARLIKALTPSGALVVDPYGGAGTTLVAAVSEGRNGLMSDLNEQYCVIAESRIAALYDVGLSVRADEPILTPDISTSVAQRPPHFKVHND